MAGLSTGLRIKAILLLIGVSIVLLLYRYFVVDTVRTRIPDGPDEEDG